MQETCGIPPQLAICNIFDQDAVRLAEFATVHGFSGIDWSIDPALPEKRFLSLMRSLAGFQVRFHCRFHGVDPAYTDQRGVESLALLMRTVDQVASAGGSHMTVHSGLGNPTGDGIAPECAIRNLSILVEHGRRNGVAVALENLTTPLTCDPCLFNRIVSESGAYVTVDLGHAHAVRSRRQQADLYERYLLPHRNRLLNAHIYHTELEGFGHVPPGSLEDLRDRLELLKKAGSCDWWVIELMKPAEILLTRDILRSYLDPLAMHPVEPAAVNPLPLSAA